ncbi:MAG: STAS domain-containing protein [Saccharothrix sp.]|nr:STAS domain-containing protein [Saccharothrix sp.]
MDVDVDFDDTTARELRRYVERIGDALDLSGECWCCDAAPPATAYLALEGRLPSHPDRDVALVWDERQGWSVAVETGCGEDLLVVAGLSGLVPRPEVVARFAARLLRGQPPADPEPGCAGPSLLARLREANRVDRTALVSVHSTRRRDTIVALVSGEVDAATADVLRAELVAQLANGPARLVVDLTDVDFLGARGIAVLVDVDRRARRVHVPVTVVAPTSRVLKPLWATGAHLVLHVCPSALREGA